MTMTLSLTPQLEKEIQHKVESGQYTSASEVVREALLVLSHYEKIRAAHLRELSKEIMVGVAQFDEGDYREFNEDEVERLNAECLEEIKNR